MKKIAVLGSTGSIGTNTLDVLRRLKDRFRVVALSADRNIELLAEQANDFRPRIISVRNGLLAGKMKALVPAGTKIVYGMEGLGQIVAGRDVDMVVFAVSGSSCINILLEAIKGKKEIALANKESIVSAGSIITRAARENGVRIIPIDSEHSAIFQCLDGKADRLSKIYLTASGGPLLNVSKRRFGSLPKKLILKHPKWNMGRKITVDSATMMNKGLEIIEASFLFDISDKFIDVLIHPEAVIHSMVEMVDGAIFAQLGVPDMRLPIQYALTYPERLPSLVKRIDFSRISALSFSKPDTGKFPCLTLARRALKAGGLAPAVLSAADEEAVKNYLDGVIPFSHIPKIIEGVLSRYRSLARYDEPTVEDVIGMAGWAKDQARSLCYH